jgi:hypothetical protein
MFTSDAPLIIDDAATSQELGINPRSFVNPRYGIELGRPPFEQLDSGDGLWAVRRVPEPSSILLLAAAFIGILLYSIHPSISRTGDRQGA